MRWFQRHKSTDASRQVVKVRQEQSGRFYVSPLCSTYENIFPQVRPLIDALKVVMPYGVGRNGAKKPLSETPELALLQSPNASMGRIEFLDLAFAMWLTESELNIHTWKNRGGHIIGYTILSPNCRVNNSDGSYYFQVTEANGGQTILYPDEVMTLRYSRNPANPDKGVSPAQTVKIQTQIADMLYQYEAAFIENGAVPAYLTFIRAATEEKFLETKRKMKNELQGPKNKGKTLFFWRQFLSNGQEKDQVEVKTIQPNNSTLAIKEIISIVKDDFNKAFGVSEFILGNDSSAKYDNAELSQQQFLEHRVKPALEAFWSQFQHELERVMGGGLGYGIDWELDVPELTERMKVKAETEKIKIEAAKVADEKSKVREETRKLQVENLTSLINAGARPEAAVKALELGKEWLEVAYGILMEKQSRIALPTTTDTTVLDGATKVESSGQIHYSDAPDNQGWVGAKVEKIDVKSRLSERLREQLFNGDLKEESTNTPAEDNPHFTVVYGLTEKGMDMDLLEICKQYVPDSVRIKGITNFESDEKNVIVAELEKTEELEKMHQAFLEQDHYPQEFDYYRPHITLCYVKRNAKVNEFIDIFKDLTGKEVKVTGYDIDNPWRNHTDSCQFCTQHTHDAKGDYEITFAETEVREKKIYEELMQIINQVVANTMGRGAGLTQKQLEAIKDAIMAELREEGILGANDSAEQIKGYLYGKEAGEIEAIIKNGGYELSDEFVQKMEERTSDLVDRLDEEAKAVANEVLNSSKEKGYTAQQIETELAKVMPRARAATIARNETVYAFRAAGLENAKSLAKEYDLKMQKIWHCHFDDRTCEICKAMDGQVANLDDSFPDEVYGVDGVQYGWKRDKWNDNGEVSSAHPNCRCRIQYKVLRESDNED